MKKIARGCYQAQIYTELIKYGFTAPPERTLRGAAKNWTGNYRRSFRALLGRMQVAGYEITRTPGPRGGEWGAEYRLTACPIAR